MSLAINAIQNVHFTSTKTQSQNTSQKVPENPVTLSGERSKLIVGTVTAGLGFGVKMLAELLDGDFAIEHLFNAGEKVAAKNFKNASKNKQIMATLGATVGLVGLFIAGMAFLYTIFKAPKIAYESKINAFTKGKDMDVYIKGNEIEKDLYTQMNERSKNADEQEKAKLKEQYLTMQMAKNRVPEWLKSS